MKLSTQIIYGVVIAAVAFCIGLWLAPEPEPVVNTETIEVINEVEVDKEVYIPYDRVVEVEKIVEKEVIVEVFIEVPTSTDELIDLRKANVDGFIDKLENKIENFGAKLVLIDDDIEVVQDKIDNKEDANTLLQTKINANNSLITALRLDDEFGNRTEIIALEDENITFNGDIDTNQNKIDGWVDDISDLNEDKEPWQDKIDLDQKCINEVNAYISGGFDYSDDVEERLENLGLL